MFLRLFRVSTGFDDFDTFHEVCKGFWHNDHFFMFLHPLETTFWVSKTTFWLKLTFLVKTMGQARVFCQKITVLTSFDRKTTVLTENALVLGLKWPKTTKIHCFSLFLAKTVKTGHFPLAWPSHGSGPGTTISDTFLHPSSRPLWRHFSVGRVLLRSARSFSRMCAFSKNTTKNPKKQHVRVNSGF